MIFQKDKKTLKAIEKVKQGHGKFFVVVTLPSREVIKLLIKFNKHESIILKVYKDGNTLSKSKEGKYLRQINKSL